MHFLAGLVLAALAGGQASSQVSSATISVSTTATQAILRYSFAPGQACSLKAADMNRRITITGGALSAGVVTITTRAPHGLLPGSVVYIESSGVAGWDGWQTISAVPDTSSFSFASAIAGSSTAGNVGVLVDDLNPNLFSGADQDSRPGNLSSGQFRIFVVGKRTADVAVDGNRYTRALQANSRHHYTLTCGTQVADADFTTQNLALGNTHADGPPVDRSRPGQYAYPTVQWTNRGQSLIDPVTGVRSVRATSPAGTASTVQTFQTAIDSDGVWQTPSGPLSSSGAATFTGPCQSGDCSLLLRADTLSLPGGATYTTGYGAGSSLDWVSVTITKASTSNAACTPRSSSTRRGRLQTQAGSDCNIVLCLTVNGVTCTSADREVGLTTKPASYTVGSGVPMDLWQDSGAPPIARPDVSRANGTVNYTDATRQVTWVSGDKFSINWTPGSRILVAGAEYQIESIQSELALTVAAPGPVGDLQQVPYSGNNFGVLIRKKTASADQVSIGYTTFQYGSSGMPGWPSTSVQDCSPTFVTVGGITGYNCFVDRELYWISQDGSDVRDLGLIALGNRRGSDGNLLWSTGSTCGVSTNYSQFDPTDGDTWYCLVLYKPWTSVETQAIVKAHYQGGHTAYTPGLAVPDCGVNGGAQPCIQFTPMQPNYADGVSVAGPAFNPEYALSGYNVAYWGWGGISQDGDLLIMTREAAGQDTKGWQFIFTLGDRTPAGTDANSIRPVAAVSSYRHAPVTWCAMHTVEPPDSGWLRFANNDFLYKSPSAVYVTTLTSGTLTATAGGGGGLETCPNNRFGVTGPVCTDIVVSGEPTLVQDGSYLQDTQVGDLIRIDSEWMRIVVKTDSNHLTVQRGYIGTIVAHTGTTLAMECGTRNWIGGHEAVLNYRADPLGLNSDWSSVVIDTANVGGHLGEGGGVRVNSVANFNRVGEAVCPSAILSRGGFCYQVRRGTMVTAITAPTMGVAEDPPFAGVLGFGNPNMVDSHPGPCQSTWCIDARPMLGGASDGAANTVGTATNPGINIGGQLWKFAGGASNLYPKTFATMAYAGRFPLVDVSGPGSAIPTDASGSYQYCVALNAGECRPDSGASDVYVNAPFVSKPYCNYPGIAVQADDTNAICLGPQGPFTGVILQFGNTLQDAAGVVSRRLGTAFSRWNQHSVFWNMSTTTTGELAFSQVRWLDGVRNEDILTVVPPYPPTDTVSRNTFIPIPVTFAAQTAGSNIIVEFGYGENGDAGSFFCTSRQETCVAASSSVNPTTPFYFEQSETYSGVSCASGCTVAIPALSQRVLYYRWKQRDAVGNVIAVSETNAIVTP